MLHFLTVVFRARYSFHFRGSVPLKEKQTIEQRAVLLLPDVVDGNVFQQVKKRPRSCLLLLRNCGEGQRQSGKSRRTTVVRLFGRPSNDHAYLQGPCLRPGCCYLRISSFHITCTGSLRL